ncbi:MAG: pyridoxamine 5'-phosphate oxidase family protein [Candidatus Hodarchaeota archaeon]
MTEQGSDLGVGFMEHKCKNREEPNNCNIRKVFSEFLLDATFMYCCTLSKKGMPHITPVLFVYDTKWCVLSFLIDKNSVKAKNLHRNPYISLTSDETHPINPFLNTGIMLLAGSIKGYVCIL